MSELKQFDFMNTRLPNKKVCAAMLEVIEKETGMKLCSLSDAEYKLAQLKIERDRDLDENVRLWEWFTMTLRLLSRHPEYAMFYALVSKDAESKGFDVDKIVGAHIDAPEESK